MQRKIYLCLFYLCLYVYVCTVLHADTLRGQNMMSWPGLELQMVVSRRVGVGTEPESSESTGSARNHRAISAAPSVCVV